MIRTTTIQKQASTGFTIVELIVVVGIVSIMSSMMLVQFTRNVKDERLKGVTREASVWLKDVQARSRQLMQTCRVQLNEESKELSITENTNDGNSADECTGIGTLTLNELVEQTSNLKICGQESDAHDFTCTQSSDGGTTASENRTSLIFTPRGTVVRSAVIKLNLDNETTNRCIAVLSPLGIVREGRENANSCDFTTAF